MYDNDGLAAFGGCAFRAHGGGGVQYSGRAWRPNRSCGNGWRLLLSVVVVLCVTQPAYGLPLSDGSDGAFTPTSSLTLDLGVVAPDGIFNFTTVNIPTNVTVRFKPSAANTPVYFLATGSVVINGKIDLSASGVEGGPGGGRGGAGAVDNGAGSVGSGLAPGQGGGPQVPGYVGNAGGGGGMATLGFDPVKTAAEAQARGTVGVLTGPSWGAGGSATGFPLPLTGGSSGGGGGGFYRFIYYGTGAGGGGGGALGISTPASLALGGSLLSNGGDGGVAFANIFGHAGPGGGGSGGAFLLEASAIALSASAVIEARGGAGGGISTQPVAFNPYYWSSGAHGGQGWALFETSALTIDPGAQLSQITVVPEPSSWLMLSVGIATVAWLVRRRRPKSTHGPWGNWPSTL